MIIKSLACDGFRNLDLFRCELSPKLNFFVGENGAGKTSILEAANWCVSGRSFRSHSIEHMICHGKSFFQLEMGLPSTTVSVLQAKKNTINDSGLAVKSEIFINQQKIKRKSELAKLMPVFMLSAVALLSMPRSLSVP